MLLIFSSPLACTAEVQVVLQQYHLNSNVPNAGVTSRESHNLEFVVKPEKSVVLLMTYELILTPMASAMFSLNKSDYLQTLNCPSSGTRLLTSCFLEHLALPSELGWRSAVACQSSLICGFCDFTLHCACQKIMVHLI